MEKKMIFNYFYGTEADQFSFYLIPKVLFTDSYSKDLSSDAKILYGLMLDLSLIHISDCHYGIRRSSPKTFFRQYLFNKSRKIKSRYINY